MGVGVGGGKISFHELPTKQGLSIIGLGLLLISTASSGLASVMNEIILKRGTGDKASEDPQMPFMLKNGVMYKPAENGRVDLLWAAAENNSGGHRPNFFPLTFS